MMLLKENLLPLVFCLITDLLYSRESTQLKRHLRSGFPRNPNFAEPWFAFCKQCEEGFCGKSVSKELQFGQESSYGALKDENLLEHYNLLNDPLFNEEIPIFWEAWKKTGNALFISKIVRHNYCCLAKEYYLKLKRFDNLFRTSLRHY